MRKSLFRLIGILVLSTILALSIAYPVLADAGEADEVKEVDGYRVKMTFVEGEAQLGHNKLSIEIDDPQGQPVTNARVTLITELYKESTTDTTSTAHNGMDMVSAKKNSASPPEAPTKTTKVELIAGPHAGEYEGEVDLSHAGHWMITAVVGLEQHEKSVDFLVDLQGTGPNWYVLSLFFGLIGAIITAGVITKRRPIKMPVPEAAR